MIIDPLPEKTRRYLELEYSFTASPDDRTKSALAQLTGLTSEEVDEWFQTQRQKARSSLLQRGRSPSPTLNAQTASDLGKPFEPTTAYLGSRKRLPIGESNGSFKEAREEDLAVSPSSDFSLGVHRAECVDPVEPEDVVEDCQETDNRPRGMPNIDDYSPQSQDLRSSRDENSLPKHDSVPANSNTTEGSSSSATTKVSHSPTGLLSGDEIPGISVFRLFDGPGTGSPRRRRRYTEEEKWQVAATRRRGACPSCRISRTKCQHDLPRIFPEPYPLQSQSHKVFELGLTTPALPAGAKDHTTPLVEPFDPGPKSPARNTRDTIEKADSTAFSYRSMSLSGSAPYRPNFTTKTASPARATTSEACTECGFKPEGDPKWRKSNLARHMRIRHSHTAATFPCTYPGCASTFSRSDNLRAHKRKAHPDQILADQYMKPAPGGENKDHVPTGASSADAAGSSVL